MEKLKFPKYNDRNCNDEKGECDTHRTCKFSPTN